MMVQLPGYVFVVPPDMLLTYAIHRRRPTAEFRESFVLVVDAVGPGDVVYRIPREWVRPTLDSIREILPPGLHRLERHPEDDLSVVEV
jgi:hypothetical protein